VVLRLRLRRARGRRGSVWPSRVRAAVCGGESSAAAGRKSDRHTGQREHAFR